MSNEWIWYHGEDSAPLPRSMVDFQMDQVTTLIHRNLFRCKMAAIFASEIRNARRKSPDRCVKLGGAHNDSQSKTEAFEIDDESIYLRALQAYLRGPSCLRSPPNVPRKTFFPRLWWGRPPFTRASPWPLRGSQFSAKKNIVWRPLHLSRIHIVQLPYTSNCILLPFSLVLARACPLDRLGPPLQH